MTNRLMSSGIKTAADISNIKISQQWHGRYSREVAYIEVPNRGKVHVEGIGPVKAKALLAWRQGIEGRLKSSLPRSLPFDQENKIKSKYIGQRQALDIQEADAKKYSDQAITLVKDKYLKEKEVLERQLVASRGLYEKNINDLNGRIIEENKNLSKKRYTLGRLENQTKPYIQIRFSKYLKSALWF